VRWKHPVPIFGWLRCAPKDGTYGKRTDDSSRAGDEGAKVLRIPVQPGYLGELVELSTSQEARLDGKGVLSAIEESTRHGFQRALALHALPEAPI
jgi:hypothetical protein